VNYLRTEKTNALKITLASEAFGCADQGSVFRGGAEKRRREEKISMVNYKY
jgi:hypothetical protein